MAPDADSMLGDSLVDADGDGEWNSERTKALAGFVLRAPRRRPVLAAALFVGLAALGLSAAATVPVSYGAESRLFAMPAPPAGEAGAVDPVKYAVDLVESDDTLASIADDTDLAARTEQARPRVLVWRDRVLGAAPSPHDRRSALVGLLRSKLTVRVDDTNVAIRAEWTDPRIAYDLVQLGRERFLRGLYDAQVKVATDRLDASGEESQIAFANLTTALRAYSDQARANRPEAAPAVASMPVSVDESGLAEQVAEKERAVRDSEARWRLAFNQRSDQLVDALGKLTRNHPAVVELQRQVDLLSQPPDDLVRLRGELADLRSRLSQLPHDTRPARPRAVVTSSPDEGAMLLARSKLDAAMRAHELADQAVNEQRVRLDVLRRTARDRFGIATLAEVPSKPMKPLAQMVGWGAMLMALLLALAIPSSLDLFTGRVLEPWQVKHRLKVPVLGEL